MLCYHHCHWWRTRCKPVLAQKLFIFSPSWTCNRVIPSGRYSHVCIGSLPGATTNQLLKISSRAPPSKLECEHDFTISERYHDKKNWERVTMIQLAKVFRGTTRCGLVHVYWRFGEHTASVCQVARCHWPQAPVKQSRRSQILLTISNPPPLRRFGYTPLNKCAYLFSKRVRFDYTWSSEHAEVT